MKCSSCQGEWTPHKNVSLSKYPFCQTDLMQMLMQKTEEQTPEIILRKLIEVYGVELLQQEQRLSAMISDLFALDKRIKKLLLLSIREKVPQKMAALLYDENREMKLCSISNHLIEDGILHEDAINQIVYFWGKVLLWKETNEIFTILWHQGYCGFQNSKGRMITPFKYDYAENFNEGIALVKLNGKYGFVNFDGIV